MEFEWPQEPRDRQEHQKAGAGAGAPGGRTGGS